MKFSVSSPDRHALRAKDGVASNSWSKRQTSFPLKKDVGYNEAPFWLEKMFEAWTTKNLKGLGTRFWNFSSCERCLTTEQDYQSRKVPFAKEVHVSITNKLFFHKEHFPSYLSNLMSVGVSLNFFFYCRVQFYTLQRIFA